MNKTLIIDIIYTVAILILFLIVGLMLNAFLVGSLPPSFIIPPEMVNSGISITIGYMVIPIIFGVLLGIIIGIISIKIRYKVVNLFFQILIILGIALPPFFIGMWLQYTLSYQLPLFPAIGDPFVPSLILCASTTCLITRQVRSNYTRISKEKYIIPHTLQTVMNMGVIFIISFILERVFNLRGLFWVLTEALEYSDYAIVESCIFLIVIINVIVLALSNGIYIFYHHVLAESESPRVKVFRGIVEERRDNIFKNSIESDDNFKEFILHRLESPLTIIGLLIVIFAIIISIFPGILTPYSVDHLSGFFAGPYNPPSPSYPLGQAYLGHDVLAILVYGIQNGMILGSIPLLIGIVGGFTFSILNKLHSMIVSILVGAMMLLFSIPTVFLIALVLNINGRVIESVILLIGIFLIPGFMILLGDHDFNAKIAFRKILIYSPLFMGFTIIFIESLGFIGLIDSSVQLGSNINLAKNNLFSSPWASLWPGLGLWILIIGFFSLYFGLKEPAVFNFRRNKK